MISSLSWAEYERLPQISPSRLWPILESPSLCKAMWSAPRKPTADMEFGTCVHAGVLEPHLQAFVVDAGGRKKEDRDRVAAIRASGLIPLKPDDHDLVRRCIDAVRAHPIAADLLDGASTEQTITWDEAPSPPEGCKSRIDAIGPNMHWIADLKTCRSVRSLEKTIAGGELGYHFSAAWRMLGMRLHGHSPAHYYIIGVTKQATPQVVVGRMSEGTLKVGLNEVERALELYNDLRDQVFWPGQYDDRIITFKLGTYYASP